MIDRDSLDENNVMSVCNTYVTIPSKTQCFQRLELLQALIETIQEIRSPIPIFEENRWKVSCEDCPASAGMQSTAIGPEPFGISNKANKTTLDLSKVVFFCCR